jgi:polyisoprenoid-binding protein YceI
VRRWAVVVVAALVAAAIVAVGVPFVYIHFIEGPAPTPLTLPKTTTTQGAAGASVQLPTGTWRATSASVVGYRVHEILFGQNNEAVGRTHSVSGSITLRNAMVTQATFTVQMATVHSDESERDNQFDGRIMDVSQFPTSTFTLTSPIALSASTKPGADITVSATGTLNLHGQTHPVTFPLHATYSSSAILINGDIPITFAAWGISSPSFGPITVDNHGLLEFLLTLHPAAS